MLIVPLNRVLINILIEKPMNLLRQEPFLSLSSFIRLHLSIHVICPCSGFIEKIIPIMIQLSKSYK